MANSNCLAGIRCPKCGDEDEFRIAASSIFEITDDGTGDHEDVEWGGESYIQCRACDHEGTVREFTIQTVEEATDGSEEVHT